jgi:hypothetical protein
LVDVAEIINKLWGHNTDGGRLFPGPVHRHLRCAALSPDSTAAVTFGSLAGVRLEEQTRDWTFAVFLAADREELIDFDWQSSGGQRFKHEPGFQMTDYPAEQIVAPTSLDDVLSFLSANNPNEFADAIDFQDRLFFVRHDGTQRPEFPRAPRDMTLVDSEEDSARWHVVRADFPMDAWVRIRDTATDEQPPLHSEIIVELIGDEAARTYAQSLASPTS